MTRTAATNTSRTVKPITYGASDAIIDASLLYQGGKKVYNWWNKPDQPINTKFEKEAGDNKVLTQDELDSITKVVQQKY